MTLKSIGLSLAMFRPAVFTLVAAIAFAYVLHSQVASKPGDVSSASADEHLLKKVEPVYPPPSWSTVTLLRSARQSRCHFRWASPMPT
jgi:hypothetical protein